MLALLYEEDASKALSAMDGQVRKKWIDMWNMFLLNYILTVLTEIVGTRWEKNSSKLCHSKHLVALDLLGFQGNRGFGGGFTGGFWFTRLLHNNLSIDGLL